MADWLAESPHAAAPLLPNLFPSWLDRVSAEAFGHQQRRRLKRQFQHAVRPAVTRRWQWQTTPGAVLYGDVLLFAIDLIEKVRAWRIDPYRRVELYIERMHSAARHLVGLYHPLDTGTVRGWRLLIAPRQSSGLARAGPPPVWSTGTRVACPGCGTTTHIHFHVTAPPACCSHSRRLVKFAGFRPEVIVPGRIADEAGPPVNPSRIH